MPNKKKIDKGFMCVKIWFFFWQNTKKNTQKHCRFSFVHEEEKHFSFEFIDYDEQFVGDL